MSSAGSVPQIELWEPDDEQWHKIAQRFYIHRRTGWLRHVDDIRIPVRLYLVALEDRHP
jgi:hypothetical protein